MLNDGYHAAQTQLGSKYLTAGVYQIEVVFFEGYGSSILEVFYDNEYRTVFDANEFKLLNGEDEI